MTLPGAASKNQFTLPDSRKLAYQLSHGSKPGPLILLSNTFGADLSLWSMVVGRLNSASFSTLAYDHVGHGDSDAPSDLSTTTLELLADDVAQLLNFLEVKVLAAWVGVSLGGAIGLYFVNRHPNVVQSLVLCGTTMKSPVSQGLIPAEALSAQVISARKAGSASAILGQMQSRWFEESWINEHPLEMQRVRDASCTTTVDGFEAIVNILLDGDWDLFDQLEQAVQGCERFQIIVGEHDEQLKETLRIAQKNLERYHEDSEKAVNVKLDIVEKAGHVPYVDGLDAFCEILLKHLSS